MWTRANRTMVLGGNSGIDVPYKEDVIGSSPVRPTTGLRFG